jgi:hypothetical protein
MCLVDCCTCEVRNTLYYRDRRRRVVRNAVVIAAGLLLVVVLTLVALEVFNAIG